MKAFGVAVAVGLAAAWPACAGQALVLATDYETGYANLLGLEPPYPRSLNIGTTCADAVVRVAGDRGYVLGRFGCDHVQVLDAAQNFAALAQWSTGSGSNPQDIEILSTDKAYVSLYDRNYVAIVDPRDGTARGSISLAGFADADGFPEAAEMVRARDRVFVAVQRLDRFDGFRANHPSFLVVIDPATDQVVDVTPAVPGVQAIPLTGRNPFAEMVFDPVRGKIVVAESGNFGVADGGIEFVDPEALVAEGWFASEAGLGGDVTAVRLWHDCTAYAVVNDASYRTKLVRFDRCTGMVASTAWQSSGFDLCDLEIDVHDQVLVADRDLVAAGVRLFDARTGSQITGSPLGFGLPPCDMALSLPETLSDAPPAVAAELQLEPNRPDPFNPRTRIVVHGASGDPLAIEILDVRGTRVRRAPPLVFGKAAVQWTWDGRNDDGVALPSGVYFVRARTANTTRVERMTLIR